jgi:hypothetical protein
MSAELHEIRGDHREKEQGRSKAARQPYKAEKVRPQRGGGSEVSSATQAPGPEDEAWDLTPDDEDDEPRRVRDPRERIRARKEQVGWVDGWVDAVCVGGGCSGL